ncbi:hypothetical protein X777_15527 [Ooceraea biroi]|uniref:Tc1-like transposase DDE domain-containing protein n=1 Tax=Ooceraea biroi TaxID=2015173 RepID=A0A026X3P4_OOCBI|nr:hypothetical protein X777_15527 [Ooceraea biroi]
MHPYKITSHQLLTKRAMTKRVEFCKTINGMFEDGELDAKLIIYTDEAHFWLNGYVNKQNYRFWGSENPNVSLAKPLHPQKITAWAAISVKGIYLQFFESTVTGESYKQLLETQFFPHAFAQGGLEWPPYSPDLNPCDFFLWGYIKDHCYAENPDTVSDLVVAIKKVVSNIKDDMLEKVFTSFRKRIDFCTNSDGAHFENIYH